MTAAEIMLQFTAITFPIFIALPTFISYLASWPTSKVFRFVLILYAICLIDLWASVILDCFNMLSRFGPECLMAIVVLVGSAIGLSIAVVILSLFVSERAIERVSEEP